MHSFHVNEQQSKPKIFNEALEMLQQTNQKYSEFFANLKRINSIVQNSKPDLFYNG